MKKIMSILTVAVMLALCACGFAFAEKNTFQVQNGGLTLNIPEEYKDLLIIETPEDGKEGVLFQVLEKASQEASKASGEYYDGAGLFFTVRKITEKEMRDLRCGEMFGESIIAKDADGAYYTFFLPTDYRFMRSNEDNLEADEAQYQQIQNWSHSVPADLIAASGLTAVNYSNTVVDQVLARILYQNFRNFELITTEHLEQSPAAVDPAPYVEKLAEGVVLHWADITETPDGQYVVLNMPEEGQRFDFFLAEGSTNYVRHVWYNEEYEELFKFEFADASLEASEIMQEWYNALVAANK